MYKELYRGIHHIDKKVQEIGYHNYENSEDVKVQSHK
jgi:hypothetical protein